MAENKNSNQGILIAIIGLIGVVAAAVISNWDKIFKTSTQQALVQNTNTNKDTSTSKEMSRNKGVLPTIDKGPSSKSKDNNVQHDEGSNSLINNFRIVLAAADNDFSSLRNGLDPKFDVETYGPTYFTTITDHDPYLRSTSIMTRLSKWQFVFALSGPNSEEAIAFQRYNEAISNAIRNLNAHFDQSYYSLGKGADPALRSVKYTSNKIEIDFERSSTGKDFSNFIIVTHLAK